MLKVISTESGPPNMEEWRSRGEIVDEICALQRRLRELQQILETTEDVAADHQHQHCLHASRVIVDSCGPRDNGELTYRCLKCGKVF